MIINETNYDIFNKVSKLTMTDYEIKWFNAENIKGYIDNEGLICMISDLLLEVERLEEKVEDIIQDRNDNYRQITPSEMYD